MFQMENVNYRIKKYMIFMIIYTMVRFLGDNKLKICIVLGVLLLVGLLIYLKNKIQRSNIDGYYNIILS